MGMCFLKVGVIVIEVVEVFFWVFEDKEIINVGYGFNLFIDGIVECDVIIVDYLG